MAQQQKRTLTTTHQQSPLWEHGGLADVAVMPIPSVTRMVPVETIRIDRLILHYLDHKAPVPLLVDIEPQVSEPELSELVHERYAKYLSYAEQNADWTADFEDATRSVSSHCLSLLHDADCFVEVTQQLALRLYNAMRLGPSNIVSGDLVVILYHVEPRANESVFQQIALLKVDPDGKQLLRTLVPRDGHTEVVFQRSTNTLPGIDSLQKCALIALSNDGIDIEPHFDIRLLDKQAGPTSPGVATFFFRGFLGASLSSSARRRTRLFLKATNAWLDQHGHEFSPEEIKHFFRVRRSFLRQSAVDLKTFAATVLEGHAESATALLAYVAEQVFEGNVPATNQLVIQTDQRVLKKFFDKVTLVLDGGLKISVSSEKFEELVQLGDQRTAEGMLRLTIDSLTLREVLE